MNRKSVFVFFLIFLILIGLTFRVWFSPAMTFVGANTDLIQGLESLVQIFIWIGVGIFTWLGLLRPKQSNQRDVAVNKPNPISVITQKPKKNKASVHGGGSIAQGKGSKAVGKGGILIEGDVSESNIISGNNNKVSTKMRRKR